MNFPFIQKTPRIVDGCEAGIQKMYIKRWGTLFIMAGDHESNL